MNYILMIISIMVAFVFIGFMLYININSKLSLFKEYIKSPVPLSVNIISVDALHSYRTRTSVVIKFKSNSYDFEKIVKGKYTKEKIAAFLGDIPGWFECDELYFYKHNKNRYYIFTDSLHEHTEFRYKR